MLRSLFSGVTGLRNHQLRLDVIGNNVANVNTIAFKSRKRRPARLNRPESSLSPKRPRLSWTIRRPR